MTRAPDRSPLSTGRRPVTRRADAGYSVVEIAIVWPAFLLLVMMVIQFTLVWHARHVAEAAARQGLRAARAFDSTSSAGPDAASVYLRRVAPHLLTGTRVTTSSTPTTVTVRVHGRVLSLIGLADMSIDEQAAGPREVFVPPESP